MPDKDNTNTLNDSIKAGVKNSAHTRAHLALIHYAIMQIKGDVCNCPGSNISQPTPVTNGEAITTAYPDVSKANTSISASTTSALSRIHSNLLEIEPTGFASSTNPQDNNASDQQDYINMQNNDLDTDDDNWQYKGIKTLGHNRFGGYGVLWGDASKPDLTQEYFTPNTEELDVFFKAIGAIPTIYHHSMNDTIKTEVVGKIDTMRADSVGLWVEGELLKNFRYRKEILKLMEAGALGFSSGTLPGARRVSQNGEIKRWPCVEFSMTPTPAEARMIAEYPISEIKSLYKSIGFEFIDPTPSDSTDAVEAPSPVKGVEKTQDVEQQPTAKEDEDNQSALINSIKADLIKLELGLIR